MALTDDVIGLPSPVSLDPGQYRKLSTIGLPTAGNSVTTGSMSGVRAMSVDGASSSGSTLTVASLIGAISSNLAGAGGVYFFRSPSASFTIPTADSAQTRVDIVYVRIWDDAVDGAGLNGVDVVYLAGTPGSGAPVVPPGVIGLRVATVTVPASSTGTTVYDPLLLPAGVIPVRGDEELPASSSGLHAGLTRWNMADSVLEVWTGFEWTIVGRSNTPRITTGTFTITPTSAVSAAYYNSTFYRATQTVTFPSGLFTANPLVVATGHSEVPGTLLEVSATNVSTTSADIMIARFTQVATAVDWIAVQT